jgi:predicted RNase H-like nuclease
MFCDDAPVWQFLARLGAVQDPEQARKVNEGLFLVEVFPALALASFDPAFFAYLGGPKYNPDRKKTFRRSDWTRVACAAARKARDLGCDELADWCLRSEYIAQPRKADQDKMDAALCVLIALLWRLRPQQDSLVMGNLVTGYMVLPATSAVRERLIRAAQKHAVEIDGLVLQS